VSKGIDSLKMRPQRRMLAPKTGALYRWLRTNVHEIKHARRRGASWSEILMAARKDSVDVGEDANARRILQKTWARVIRAEEKFQSSKRRTPERRNQQARTHRLTLCQAGYL